VVQTIFAHLGSSMSLVWVVLVFYAYNRFGFMVFQAHFRVSIEEIGRGYGIQRVMICVPSMETNKGNGLFDNMRTYTNHAYHIHTKHKNT